MRDIQLTDADFQPLRNCSIWHAMADLSQLFRVKTREDIFSASYVYYQFEDGSRYYFKNRWTGKLGLIQESEYEEFRA